MKEPRPRMYVLDNDDEDGFDMRRKCFDGRAGGDIDMRDGPLEVAVLVGIDIELRRNREEDIRRDAFYHRISSDKNQKL